ncbi:MAG: hypothetical protein WC675_02330 [Patescibacteria group bacterium]|jgi:hypothetical protein
MIKKVLTYSVAVATIVWSVGILAIPFSVGAAVSGDLIKLQCAAGAEVNDPCKAVYYLGADSKRYVFPNEKTYKTWYPDFSGVQIVSSTEMSSYAIGGNVTYRPGVKLVKINTDPKVYAVGANGTLHWVTTGAIAETLYGANWATTSVDDISDAFFVNYTVGADIDAASDFDKAAETSAATSINDDKNLTSGGAVSTGTSLTVALASDTAASGIVVANSINNKFTKVNLTASADGDIVIDQLVVRRGGTVASDTPFSSIALIDAATDVRIGTTKTLNSTHQAVFNKDITVTAGTTKTIYLAGNMGATASYAGEIPSLDLYSITLSGTAAVIGTLPIVGNYQTLNGTVTIGTLTTYNGSNNPSASTQKVGVTNYIASGVKLTAGSVEDFKVTQISFKQGGTASDSDVANLDLLVDDAVVKTVAEPVDGVVTFDLSASPVLIAKGRSVQFDLQLDIASGSARTIRFDVNDESDIRAKGQLYGSEVKVACGSGCTVDAEPFWTAPLTTVSTGSLRIGSSTLSNANIPEDDTQIVLGKFEFEAKGEAVEITSLPIAFKITTSTGNLGTDTTVDLTNVSVYDENGVIVAGPDDPTLKYYDDGGTTKTAILVATSTDTVTVPVGVHIYTVKADLDSDFGTGDTIIAHIKPAVSATAATIVAKGENTGLTIYPTPYSEQTSATMTVQSAALAISVSPTPGAATVVGGTKGHTFANIIIGAESSGEDIKVTAVKVAVHSSTANPSQVSNWSLWNGSTELSVTNDPDSDTSGKTAAGNSATSTFTLSTPLVITKGTSKTLTIKGDIATSATSGSITVGLPDKTGSDHITAKGNSSALDAIITVSQSDGQAQTFTTTGTLTLTQSSATPKAGFIPGNTAGVSAAVLLIQGTKENINIEKMYVTAEQVNSGGFDQIDTLYLYNGSTLVGSVVPTATDAASKTALLDLTSNPLVIPKDTTVTLTFKVDTPVVNYELNGDTAGFASSYQGFYLSISGAGDIVAKGAESGQEVTASLSTASGKSLTLVRSIPKVTLTETGGTIPAGTNTKVLSQFTVAADSGGDIGLMSVSFLMTTTTATVTNVYLYAGGTKVGTASSTFIDAGGSKGTIVQKFFLTTDGAIPAFAVGTALTNLLPSESIIAAGSSQTYQVKGDIECASSFCSHPTTPTGGTVNTKFMADSSAITTGGSNLALYLKDPSAYNYGELYNFVWTDWWRMSGTKNSSSTCTSTAEQWYNGYLVTDAGSPPSYISATTSGTTWSK